MGGEHRGPSASAIQGKASLRLFEDTRHRNPRQGRHLGQKGYGDSSRSRSREKERSSPRSPAHILSICSQTPHPMPASHDLREKMSQERLSPAAVVPEGILPSRRASCAGLVGHSSTCKSSTDWSLLCPQNLGCDSSCLCELPKQEVNAPERSCKAHGRLFSAREEEGAAARS